MYRSLDFECFQTSAQEPAIWRPRTVVVSVLEKLAVMFPVPRAAVPLAGDGRTPPDDARLALRTTAVRSANVATFYIKLT